MRASKVILCGVVLAAISLAMVGCGPKREGDDRANDKKPSKLKPTAGESADKTGNAAGGKPGDRECIRVINEYFDAVNKQDIKRALEVTVGQAARAVSLACALQEVFDAPVVMPVNARLRKEDGPLGVYDVTVTSQKGGKSTKLDSVVILTLVKGRRKIVGIVVPEEWVSDIDPAIFFKDVSQLDIGEVTEEYQWQIAALKGIKNAAKGSVKSVSKKVANTLRKPYFGRFNSFDPATCDDIGSASIQAYVFEGLYGYHYLKRPVEVIPFLANGMPEISQDGLVWTIKIKSNVKYSRNPCFGLDERGNPKTRTVTADDFVLAFKRIADSHVESKMALSLVRDEIVGISEFRKKTSSYAPGDFSRYDKEKLDGVVALDEHTVRIKLKQITPPFLDILTLTQYAPIPREVIAYYLAMQEDERGHRKLIPIKQRKTVIPNTSAMVGTGPYVLFKYLPNQAIFFNRNQDFRDQRYPSQGQNGDKEAGLLADAGKRVPFIDGIHLMCGMRPDLHWMPFVAGMIDETLIPANSFSKVLGRNLRLAPQYTGRAIKIATSRVLSVFYIGLNMEDPILSKSKSLRQAMSMCIDNQSYLKTICRGRGKPAVNCLPSGIVGHKEAGPSPYARFDITAAKRKLITARKELEAAGLLKDGRIPTLTLELMSLNGSIGKESVPFLKSQFATIGLKLDVKLNDRPTLLGKINKKKAQMFTLGWHADYPDPENFLQQYYSPNIKQGTNDTRYSNPIFDDLFRKLTTLPNGTARTELCAKLVNMISEDCPIIAAYEPVAVVAYHTWLRNVKLHPFLSAHGMVRYHRIDTEARSAIQKELRQGPFPLH